jgi:hypothetical protein
MQFVFNVQEFQSLSLIYGLITNAKAFPRSAVTRRRQGYAGRAESPFERRLCLRTPGTAIAVVNKLTWTLDIPCWIFDCSKVAALWPPNLTLRNFKVTSNQLPVISHWIFLLL